MEWLIGLVLCLLAVTTFCWLETRWKRTEIQNMLLYHRKQQANFDGLLNILLNRKILERSDFGE